MGWALALDVYYPSRHPYCPIGIVNQVVCDNVSHHFFVVIAVSALFGVVRWS